MFGHKKEKRLAKIDAKYISGHPLYYHEKGTDVLFYVDRMKFDNMDITIPYAAITRLGGQEDRHITKTRAFLTPLFVGLFWKKKYRYTVIEYNDGIQDQTVILDFHKEANKAQRIIYNQMAGARQKQKGLTESEQKGLTEANETPEQRNIRSAREHKNDSAHCASCGKFMWFTKPFSKPLCKDCQKLEKEREI
jgi:hypothetical protein